MRYLFRGVLPLGDAPSRSEAFLLNFFKLRTVEAEAVLADKAYDADERVRKPLAERGIEAVIPSKKIRTQPLDYDRFLYQARHLVENFFARLKQYRAIATRYDKRSVNFLGGIYLAASVIGLL